MSRFIRKAKTASGATAVQVVYKQGRRVTSIEHIGSAPGATEPGFLEALARKRMDAGQIPLELSVDEASGIFMEGAHLQAFMGRARGPVP